MTVRGGTTNGDGGEREGWRDDERREQRDGERQDERDGERRGECDDERREQRDGTRERPLLRLYPDPGEHVALKGLYLSRRFGPPQDGARSFVYTSFITSLDGRIAVPDPRTLRRIVPPEIANARDWRLFQEVAASADALVVSGQYVRRRSRPVSSRSFPLSTAPEYADLLAWRAARGLPPQPAIVIVTASLDLPPLDALAASGRKVYVATGGAANAGAIARIEAEGVRVLRAGAGARVEGGRLVEVLAHEGHMNVAMVSGGQVLEALVVDGVLDRLYLTLACRLLGGLAFDTLFTGPALPSAARFKLAALHYDADGDGAGADDAGADRAGADDAGGDDAGGERDESGADDEPGAAVERGAAVEQLFAVLDRSRSTPVGT